MESHPPEHPFKRGGARVDLGSIPLSSIVLRQLVNDRYGTPLGNNRRLNASFVLRPPVDSQTLSGCICQSPVLALKLPPCYHHYQPSGLFQPCTLGCLSPVVTTSPLSSDVLMGCKCTRQLCFTLSTTCTFLSFKRLAMKFLLSSQHFV